MQTQLAQQRDTIKELEEKIETTTLEMIKVPLNVTVFILYRFDSNVYIALYWCCSNNHNKPRGYLSKPPKTKT